MPRTSPGAQIFRSVALPLTEHSTLGRQNLPEQIQFSNSGPQARACPETSSCGSSQENVAAWGLLGQGRVSGLRAPALGERKGWAGIPAPGVLPPVCVRICVPGKGGDEVPSSQSLFCVLEQSVYITPG